MDLMREADLGGPTGMARFLEAEITALEAKRTTVAGSARRPINRRLHTLRGLLAWCKSRAGYVETPADVGVLGPGEGE